MADLRNLTFGVNFDINDRGLRRTNDSVDRMSSNFRDGSTAAERFSNRIGGANSVMNRFGRTTNNVTNRSLGTFGNTLSRVTKIAAGYLGIRAVAGGIKSVGSAGLEGAADLEQYRNTLNRVMGSQEEAAKTFQWAIKFANKTPFSTESIVEASVKLESYGMSAKKNIGIIGDMSSVMGKSIDQGVEAIADAQNILAIAS
ncbi:hypothetical protein [Dethiothermospora halolimnae]|uniref:hypothetical protein n=1 Tax=Dethiothermospora halolimnae TaxID=3114390 RepID=UPI003CCC42C0